MSITPYNTERMGMLKQLLINNAESGKPTDYEIRVDDMKVVPRTNDVDQFDNHEEFVAEETRKVIVMIFDGNSRRNTRHTFLLKEDKKPQQNTLSGIEVEKIVSEKLQQEKKDWQREILEKENKELKKKLEEADEFIGKQSAAIEKLKSGRKLEDMHWGELIGIAGESLLRRNTHLIAKVPGMKGLAGIIEKDNTEPEKQIETPKPEVEASYKMKEEKAEPEKKQPEISKEDKDRLDFLKQLQERFSEDELRHVLTLLNLLVEKPKAIESTAIFAFQWKEPVAEQKPSEAQKVETKSEEIKQEIPPEEKQEEKIPEENSSTIGETPEDELEGSSHY